jgi:hypothetical protein
MADDTRDAKPEAVDAALDDMKLEEGDSPAEALDTIALNGTCEEAPTPNDIKRSRSSTPVARKSSSQSPIKKQSASQTPKSEYDEETVGGDITVSVEPGKGPKLSRKASQKIVARPPQLFDHLPDATDEALTVFQVIKDCLYGSKYFGSSNHDALDCDCSEEWSEQPFFLLCCEVLTWCRQ